MKRLAVILPVIAFTLLSVNAYAQGSIVPTGTQHEASASWVAPTVVGGSGTILGYNIWRTPSSGPANYVKLNGSVINGVTFMDTTVTAGTGYSYCASTVDTALTESACTVPVTVTIPTNPAKPTGLVVTAK